MRGPHLRTVTVDFRRVDEMVMVRYEFEDTVPISYCGAELTADMPQTVEIDQFIFTYPCHGQRGSRTLYIGNGTNKVQKYKNTKGGTMPYLSNIAKKLLDADTKVLVKAGYLDSELELTEQGAAELIEILFLANKPAMVASAKAKIKEAKENE